MTADPVVGLIPFGMAPGKLEITQVVDIELVIFDCDGVLVESEGISLRVLSEYLRETGLQVSREEVDARFMGPRLKDIVVEVEAAVGRELGDAWIAEFEERRMKIFETELMPIPGACHVVSFLTNHGVRLCVATQGRLETTHRKRVSTAFRGSVSLIHENGRSISIPPQQR